MPNTPPAAIEFIRISEAIIQPIISSTAILTNLASLVILPRSALGESLKVCLMSLTVFDICAATTSLLNCLLEEFIFDGRMPYGHWSNEAILMYTIYYLNLVFLCSSAVLVTCIAFMRCLTIVKPIAARITFTPFNATIVCCSIAIITFLLFVPCTVSILWMSCFAENLTTTTFGVCQDILTEELKDFSDNYLLALSGLYGVLPLVVNLICIVVICSKLKVANRQSRNLWASTNQERHMLRRLEDRASITKMLVGILILDVVCILPTFIQALTLSINSINLIFDEDRYPYNILDAVAEVFLCSRPAYNFWLYVFTVKDFRNQLVRALRAICPRCCFSCCEDKDKRISLQGSDEKNRKISSEQAKYLSQNTEDDDDAVWSEI